MPLNLLSFITDLYICFKIMLTLYASTAIHFLYDTFLVSSTHRTASGERFSDIRPPSFGTVLIKSALMGINGTLKHRYIIWAGLKRERIQPSSIYLPLLSLSLHALGSDFAFSVCGRTCRLALIRRVSCVRRALPGVSVWVLTEEGRRARRVRAG